MVQSTKVLEDSTEDTWTGREFYRFRPSVIDPLRNAVAFIQSGGDREISVAGQLAIAVCERVHALSERHNGGRPFPQRTAELKRGRRAK